MKTAFLITGLLIILVANLVMVYSSLSPSSMEGFTNYFLSNAAPTGKEYKPIGSFDEVRVSTGNDVSTWRYTEPNEPLLGKDFELGPDNLFIFVNNQAKPGCCSASYSSDMGCVCTTPQQRNFINTRGGNRTMEDGV
jgi:hypothetical protein